MSATTLSLPPGVAPVKPEYIISVRSAATPNNEREGTATNITQERTRGDSDSGEPPAKKQKLTGAQGQPAGERKKKTRGANKGRKFGKVTDGVELCWKLASGLDCEFGEKCRFTHDLNTYLSVKPRDIRMPSRENLSSAPPFVSSSEGMDGEIDPSFPSVDFTTSCPIFRGQGQCRYGFKCRFLGAHARKVDHDPGIETFTVPKDKENTTELNFVEPDTLKQLRTKKYPTPIADEYLKAIQQSKPANKEHISADVYDENGNKIVVATEYDESQADMPDVPLRHLEKKRLRWEGKTYLAPLTTVGNLPFRRLCVMLGADITCGEMGLATSFLSASKEEWSLVRRHPSERNFGIQLAGNKPATLVPAAEIMAKEFAGTLDFVDLNCGCPIDLVFKNGAGAALLDQPTKLGKILTGMNRALGDIPLTLKVRTGVKDGRNTAHKFMPRVDREWGASAITIHGRSRQQRYTKLADWNYIKQCVEALRVSAEDDDLPTIPIFGGGDCYSSQSYWDAVESTGVDGVMIARGALIKPWIFTEIQERMEWDISSVERLDLIRQYAEFGLNHFGSDTAGVNTTRRYLCEALSFQYRYIPIGLLERLPGKLNERPPPFRGRNELETLLASGDSRTWIKISEMFLGAAPERFVFTPKHKSNAYGDEEAQG